MPVEGNRYGSTHRIYRIKASLLLFSDEQTRHHDRSSSFSKSTFGSIFDTKTCSMNRKPCDQWASISISCPFCYAFVTKCVIQGRVGQIRLQWFPCKWNKSYLFWFFLINKNTKMEISELIYIAVFATVLVVVLMLVLMYKFP